MEISLEQMLAARDARVQQQRRLLEHYGKSLICFTMNIAGPVKNSQRITWGFLYGKKLLNAQLSGEKLPVLHFEEQLADTGCVGFWVVDAPAKTLKKLTCQIEDSLPVGRLFDMDILLPDGRKLERGEIGLEGRKCLICGGPALICSSRRTHTVEELWEKTLSLLQQAKETCLQEQVASLAVRSLLYEVCTTPKPGLVDMLDTGSHADMDIFTFLSSSAALSPYFARCCRIGQETAQKTPAETFDALRFPGKVAEAKMYAATGGVNTHKGAIFSLGLLCAAVGRKGVCSAEALLSECAAMTRGVSARELTGSSTVGQTLYAAHGITGVRGQAEAGFPAVLHTGLPLLRQCLAKGFDLNRAGSITLLHLICHAEDTNLLHRGGMEVYEKTKEQLQNTLSAQPFPETSVLREWNDRFVAQNLSPGGSADLLTLTYFLYFLEMEG